MSGNSQDDPELSDLEATGLINEIASNPATRVIPTKHAFDQQSVRLITLGQCIAALQFGTVTHCRKSSFRNKATCLYSVEYVDEFGPIRIVTRIKSVRVLVVITAICLNNLGNDFND